MKISASFLNIREDKKEEIEKLEEENIDYFHLDVMDGIFVDNKTYSSIEFAYLLENTTKPKDVHLMVSDVKSYIDSFSRLKPEFITFHYEAVSDVDSVINYIKDLNIKVGISIKPSTDLSEIYKYLGYIDLVLIMSVEPGHGGQLFIPSSVNKLDKLKEIREKENYNYVIEVDGGINNSTINDVVSADIVVVGSYITNSDNYKERVDNIKNRF